MAGECGESCGQIEVGVRRRGEQARDGDLPPSGWTLVGGCASGPLATSEHRVAAAGQTGEGHGGGGGFGDGGDLHV
jgi:hypothetical protein